MVREYRGCAEVDWERLHDTVHNAVRFLGNVIEVNRFPISESERMTRCNRKIGLGVMGFADMLIRLGISYESDEGIGQAEKIMQAVAEEALNASQGLAEEQGVFPNWKGSLCDAQGLKVRNATRTAIAPTGTISIIAGTSHSIEPLFALAYRRTNVLDGQTLHKYNPIFLQYMQRQGLDSETVVNEILKQGSIKGENAIHHHGLALSSPKSVNPL